jgi:peptide deformylase
MILGITKGADNPILRAKSPRHEQVTKKTLKLLKDMEDSMKATNGVGIAAPQIGVNTRVVIITVNRNRKVFPMINPEILELSGENNEDTEGCLSLPGKWGPVERANEVKVKFTNTKDQEQIMVFTDFEARIVQHEVDHLNGKLFIDHVPVGQLRNEA